MSTVQHGRRGLDLSPSTVVDVHAHYMPRAALDQMSTGRAVVRLETWCGVDDHITLNAMPVGTVIDRLHDVDSMLREMDATGVDVRVLSPPPFTYRYWADPIDGLALCRLINEATSAVVSQHPDRFIGFATVPMQDAGAAVTELVRGVEELGLNGLAVGTNVAGRHLSAPGCEDVLAAAAADGLPVLVHPDFVPNERLSDHYLVNLIGLPTESAASLASLVLDGTLGRLPDLRICFVHGGGSFPYLLGRLDWGWKVRPETGHDSDRRPSESIDNVFFDGLTHDPVGLRFLIDIVGPRRVVVGTDAPFDVALTDPLGHLAATPRLTAEEKSIIEHESAREWLIGLPSQTRR